MCVCTKSDLPVEFQPVRLELEWRVSIVDLPVDFMQMDNHEIAFASSTTNHISEHVCRADDRLEIPSTVKLPFLLHKYVIYV